MGMEWHLSLLGKSLKSQCTVNCTLFPASEMMEACQGEASYSLGVWDTTLDTASFVHGVHSEDSPLLLEPLKVWGHLWLTGIPACCNGQKTLLHWSVKSRTWCCPQIFHCLISSVPPLLLPGWLLLWRERRAGGRAQAWSTDRGPAPPLSNSATFSKSTNQSELWPYLLK